MRTQKGITRYLVLIFLSIVLSPSYASDAPFASSDPLLEKRVMAVAEELRCLVCQNQTIADSHAELAIDLKNQVREMLVKGKSEEEIKRYMVERYGDFVLYRPQVRSTTWILWAGPFVLLLAGLCFLVVRIQNRSRKLIEAGDGLSHEGRARAEALLGIDQTPAGPTSESKSPSSHLKA